MRHYRLLEYNGGTGIGQTFVVQKGEIGKKEVMVPSQSKNSIGPECLPQEGPINKKSSLSDMAHPNTGLTFSLPENLHSQYGCFRVFQLVLKT